MRRRFEAWKPSIGDSITGKILFFNDHNGAFIVIMRTKNRYLSLPAEARDLFLDGRPREGSSVTIGRDVDGYHFNVGLAGTPGKDSFALETTYNDDL